MAPNIKDEDLSLVEDTYERSLKLPPRKYKIVWYMVFYFSYLHGAAVYGLYIGVTTAMWYTIVFSKSIQKKRE